MNATVINYNVIYTGINTTMYTRKSLNAAKRLALKLMEKDNAKSVQIEKVTYEPEGTTTEIISFDDELELLDIAVGNIEDYR